MAHPSPFGPVPVFLDEQAHRTRTELSKLAVWLSRGQGKHIVSALEDVEGPAKPQPVVSP
jgi:hypothetical protein